MGGSVTLADFDAQIGKGLGAGSHSWQGSLSCTTGVDCSGFVSQVWQLPERQSTSTLPSVTEVIDRDDLLPGDALNEAGSHVVLWAATTGEGRPVVYEASGSASRVRIDARSGWSSLSGYTPLRRKELRDQVIDGTTDKPRHISATPYQDAHWTAGAASDVIERYDCATDKDESGPEVFYRLDVVSAGKLSARVSGEAGVVDPDLHLLKGEAKASTCVARDDSDLSYDLTPGAWFLVVDSFAGGSTWPGPYLLTVTYGGELGEVPVTALAPTTPPTGPETTPTPPPAGDAAEASAGGGWGWVCGILGGLVGVLALGGGGVALWLNRKRLGFG